MLKDGHLCNKTFQKKHSTLSGVVIGGRHVKLDSPIEAKMLLLASPYSLMSHPILYLKHKNLSMF
jgi:hypothetical protein